MPIDDPLNPNAVILEPPMWICEICQDTGQVLSDGTGLAWVIFDPCYDPDCPFKNFDPR